MSKRRNSFLLWVDRVLAQGLGSQLLILFGMMVLAFLVALVLLSLSPDWSRYCNENRISAWAAPVYLLIDGNAFTSVHENAESGRVLVFLACIIYLVGVFLFTGMMVSVITNIIERRVERHRNGLVHYLWSDHYVLMGYDDTISTFISYILEKDPQADILLLTSKPPVEAREKLLNFFSETQLRQVIINYGHRTSKEEFPKIHLEKAKEIFIVGYQGSEAHDAINIECLDAICDYLVQCGGKDKPGKITCVFRDLDTYSSFKTADIFSHIKKLGIEFVPYNYDVSCARQILTYGSYKSRQNGKEFHYPSLYGKGRGVAPEDEHFVHLVFVGTTNVAVAIALEAAHVLHFPNFSTGHSGAPGITHSPYFPKTSRATLITFIDKNADVEKDVFITRNRHFFEVQPYLYQDLTASEPGKVEVREEYLRAKEGMETGFLDVQFQFIKGDVFSLQIQRLLSSWAMDTGQYLSVFLAQANHQQNFVMSMNMPDAIYDRGIPLFIRQNRSDNLVTNLREKNISESPRPFYTWDGQKAVKEDRDLRYSHIYPFGMNETVYNDDALYFKRAKLINYLYDTAGKYNYEQFEGLLTLNAMPAKEIWDKADELWNGLTVALKWSNLYNAYTIDTKRASLRAMRGLAADDDSQDFRTLSDREAEAIAETEHNRWNVEKLLMGFRKPLPSEDKYAPEDADAKALLKKNKDHGAHHDIRPFEKLDDVVKLDYEFSRYIPWILKMTTEK